ncbi:MAG: hypothetical protein Q4G69_00205 [Planctomycetia bacterium]|nr:hypothetical protein [Planctomycetia bacterium]
MGEANPGCRSLRSLARGWKALGFQPAGFGYNIENRSLVFGRKTVLLNPVGMAENRCPEGGYRQ